MKSSLLAATYRMQFRPEFTLADAEKQVSYLARLGVSHLYASPVLQAAPGSTHGYDVVDYNQVNQELGGRPALERLSRALGEASLGMIMDLVPNHMAIHPSNPWWWDVLTNGPSSQYAGHFDVEWDPPEARHANVVLIPVLGDHYGRILEAGEIRLGFERDTFTIHYFDNVYPVDPGSLGNILEAAADRAEDEEARTRLAFLAGVHARLPESSATDLASARRRYRDSEVLRELLGRLVREQPAAGKAIQDVLDAVNQDADALDAFLQRQNYRLALWKISARELGYRRFFDINTLIGMRVENEEVYRDMHALVFDLFRRGMLDGLRIDHPDGLRDPEGYFARLREALDQEALIPRPLPPYMGEGEQKETHGSTVPLSQKDTPFPYMGEGARRSREGVRASWIVIEKILEPGEKLPEDWAVQGTTGYDFLNRANGLFVDSEAEAPLTDFYQRFTGLSADYLALVREKKRMAATQVLGSDLARLTELFYQICERNRSFRDYTRGELHWTLSEVAACLPVYRTYISPANPMQGENGAEQRISPADQAYIEEAVESAKENQPAIDPRLFDFLRDLLLLKYRGQLEEELVARFQQFTGPVMAKGVEDTVFYIYNRFISLNEVGGDPGRFGVSPDEFHKACAETQARWPFSMLSSSTHDTKRSEDVRARLNVLSELPGPWTAAVERWAQRNERHRAAASSASDEEGQVLIDRNTEYLLYQTLVGAWPISADRVVVYMQKAGREGKVFTTWTAPNAAYEAAVENFIRAILADEGFVADLEEFVARVRQPGWINSLAQTLLKLVSPGVPDIYQGTEVWDLSLVDPDNRRPVDYARRAALLKKLDGDITTEAILNAMEDGLPKLWLIRQALALRHQHPEWFGAESSYTPLSILDGTLEPAVEPPILDRAEADEVLEEPEMLEPILAVTGREAEAASDPALAFLRGEHVLAAIPRLTLRYRARWNEYALEIPPGRWRNVLTDEAWGPGRVSLADLFARFPVALLVKDGEQEV